MMTAGDVLFGTGVLVWLIGMLYLLTLGLEWLGDVWSRSRWFVNVRVRRGKGYNPKNRVWTYPPTQDGKIIGWSRHGVSFGVKSSRPNSSSHFIGLLRYAERDPHPWEKEED